MANRNSPQSSTLQHQVPNKMRIGIEIPRYPDTPKPELTRSPLVGDEGPENFLGLFYRVDEETLEEWANIAKFMLGGLVVSVEEPDITTNFRDFPLKMFGNIWEKRIFG